jgi:hypothetical protein
MTINYNQCQEIDETLDLLKHQCDGKVCGAQSPWNTYVYRKNAENNITKLHSHEIFGTQQK